MRKLTQIQNRLKDERSGKIIFLSHCLLNMNARYLGGASRNSCVAEIIQGAIERDIAIIQMKCPEQQAWGGILKPLMWLAFERKRTTRCYMRAIILPIFLHYTRLRYRRIARAVINEIYNYEDSGYKVIGIVGIDGSPTCGVNQRIDMKRAFDLYASSSVQTLNREEFNRNLYAKCLSSGSGIFIDELKRGLDKKRIIIPLYSHSLLDEMKLNTDSIWEVIT
ncbi:MAG: hypothetical protein ACM3MK_10705 [Chitinophagales bacterium]